MSLRLRLYQPPSVRILDGGGSGATATANPSETLIKAKQERLDNWHTLQELAGII